MKPYYYFSKMQITNITCDDPVQMNENIKSKIKSKNLFYKQYTQNGPKESDFIVLGNLMS